MRTTRISGGYLEKLSFRNAKRSVKDYSIYLLTMAFIASLMIAFDAMIFSDAVVEISKNAGLLAGMLGLATFFIVLIVVWLVHYMVRFMAHRRSREFGTYLLLGFRKNQIGTLFFRESVFLGAAAFGISLLPGILLQQVVTTLIYAMLDVDYRIKVDVKPQAFFMAFAIYFFAYFIALFGNKRRFAKMKIRDMLDLERQNEELKGANKSGKWWLLFVSVGYMLLFVRLFYAGDINDSNIYALLILLVVCVYGLYAGLAAFLVGYIKKGGGGTGRGATVFLLRQFASKIKTMQFTLGTLTILFMAALFGTSIALMLNQYQNTQGQEKWPFDIAIYHENPNYTFTQEQRLLGDSTALERVWDYRIYQNGTDDWSRFMDEKVETGWQNAYFTYDTYMRLSDYNELRDMLGYAQVELGEGEYILQIKNRMKDMAEQMTKQPVEIGGVPYICGGVYTEGFEQNGHNGADFLLVVSDDAVRFMEPYYALLMAQTSGVLPDNLDQQLLALQEACSDKGQAVADAGYNMDNLNRGVGSDSVYVSNSYVFVAEKENREMKFIFSAVMLPLFYTGLVFLCVALTVLAVQQLSDSDKYKYRYGVLRTLGMRKKEMGHLVFLQLFLYYLCPFLGALLMSGGMIAYIGRGFVALTGVAAPAGSYFATSIILFGSIYLLYFAATYVELRRSL